MVEIMIEKWISRLYLISFNERGDIGVNTYLFVAAHLKCMLMRWDHKNLIIQHCFRSWDFAYYFSISSVPYAIGRMILFKQELGFHSCSSYFISLHFTLLSLKRICILQLMITSKIYGMVSTKCNWISRCIHYKNNSTRWHQYDSFSIEHSNGHRPKTPAIARCLTFYTTVSPLRRKYMEERRERVIKLSSDSMSFLQHCVIDYFGELRCR